MCAHLLECTGLSMRFGGLMALQSLDIHVDSHEVVGLVGPNGSGKTTFFNVVTGIYHPCAGKVMFNGQDITGLSPQEVYRAGIARTFQRSRLCLDLTVFDNIMIGSHKTLDLSFVHNILHRKAFLKKYREYEETAAALLRALNPDLPGKLHHAVSELNMIDRRRVELCRALIGKPKLLFLDEPSAGMTHEETQQLMDEIVRMETGEAKPAIVLIEHEMNVIRRITSRCVVLNFGEKLCEGSYEKVTADPMVQEAYLGTEVCEDEQV